MKINKYIFKHLQPWTKSYNRVMVNNFIQLILSIYKQDEDLKEILSKEFNGKRNQFFINDVYCKDDGSWLGKLIDPRSYQLNDRMWWFITGWMRSRNQILNAGDQSDWVYTKENQKCFIGLVKPHETTLLSMNNFFKNKNIDIDENILEEFHNHIVQYYLKNQNVIIGDQ